MLPPSEHTKPVTSFHDLGLAYRKAKVNLYYSSHASFGAIAGYEDKLHANLTALLEMHVRTCACDLCA
jgi:hypothetical protein